MPTTYTASNIAYVTGSIADPVVAPPTSQGGIPSVVGNRLICLIDGRDRALEVVNYSVNQQINSIVPGDNSGGTSSATVVVRAGEDADLLHRYLSCVDRKLTLIDARDIEFTNYKGRGAWKGTISKASRVGNQITFQVDSILNRLNVDKSAEPVFGRATSGFATTYVINLATNPSAESNVTGYTAQAGTSGTASIAQATPTPAPFAGTKSARVSWTVAATAPGGVIYTQAGLTSGVTYNFSANLITNGAQQVQISLQWLSSGGSNVGSVILGDNAAVSNGTWSNFQMQATAPDTATQAKLYFLNYNDSGMFWHQWANGDTLDIDGVMITSGTSDFIPFADGSFPNGTWLGTANNSQSQISIQVPIDPGYDATFSYAFRYYAGLCKVATTSIVIDSYFDGIFVQLPRWSGNVLDSLKALCAAYGAVFRVVNDIIQVTRPRQRYVRIQDFDRYSQDTQSQGLTRSINVYNYNNTWYADTLAATPENVYSLDPGASTNFSISTPHHLTKVNNPVCVSVINPTPYVAGTGQFVITDSNNNAVNPKTWNAAGGRLTVMLNPDDKSKIDVSVFVPNTLPGYIAPYRLSSIVNAVESPALYITGTGVFVNKQTVNIATGASESNTKIDSLPNVDNIFMSNAGQTHDAGLRAADQAAGAVTTFSGRFGFDPDSNGQEFGIVDGARFKFNYGIYTISQTTTTPSGIDIQAAMDVTFDDLTDLYAMIFNEFNATYTGLTFSTFNALFTSGQTMDNFNSVSANPTLADFNATYAGAVFNDHSVYPYMRGKVIEDAEARA